MVSKRQLKSSTPKRYIFQQQVCALTWAAQRTPTAFCHFPRIFPSPPANRSQTSSQFQWLLTKSLWSFWSCKRHGQIILRLFIFSCLKILRVIHWSVSWRGWRMYRKHFFPQSWTKCLQFGNKFVVLILRLNGTRHLTASNLVFSYKS